MQHPVYIDGGNYTNVNCNGICVKMTTTEFNKYRSVKALGFRQCFIDAKESV